MVHLVLQAIAIILGIITGVAIGLPLFGALFRWIDAKKGIKY